MREKTDLKKRASSCLQGVVVKKTKTDIHVKQKQPETTTTSDTKNNETTSTSITTTLSPLENAMTFVKNSGKGEIKVNADGSFSIVFP